MKLRTLCCNEGLDLVVTYLLLTDVSILTGSPDETANVVLQ